MLLLTISRIIGHNPMPPAPTAKSARPLSPHLQIYRPQLTSVMSILHRLTGIALALGLPVFVVWLMGLAAGPQTYGMLIDLFKTPVGQILLCGWSWAFFYHFCTGIRHLLWDSGFFLGIKGVYATGWIAFGVSTLVTAAVWAHLLEWI